MSQKTKWGLGLGLLLGAAGAFLALWDFPKNEAFCVAKASEAMTNVLKFRLTNSWHLVRANGGVTARSLFERKRREYFLLQEGSKPALVELKNKLDAMPPNNDTTFFEYLPQHDPLNWQATRGQLRLAPWWRPEQQGTGLFAKIAINHSNLFYCARLTALDRGTNVWLFTHVLVEK